MSKINELIKELCPNGVEYKKLEDCCNILDSKRKPVSRSAREPGKYPYYGANGIQDYIHDYIFDGKYVLVGEDGSVQTAKGTPIVNWAVGKMWVNNHAHIIEETEGVSLRYLYHYLQTVNVEDLIHGNIPKITQGDFRNIKVAIPPIEVQEEIVRILDKFGKLEAELEAKLEAELEARQSQYEFWREKIFSKDDNLMTIGYLLESKGYIRGPFGSALVKADMVTEGIPIYEQKHAIYNHRDFRYFITLDKAKKLERFSIKPNDLIISCSGTVGKVSVILDNDPKGIINQALLILRLNKNLIMPKYMKYYLESPLGYRSITANTNKSAQVNIASRDAIEKIMIPVPPLEEQERIINILDKFDALVNDMTEGILAEIELRRQQYEYYRNKLLSFEELSIY